MHIGRSHCLLIFPRKVFMYKCKLMPPEGELSCCRLLTILSINIFPEKFVRFYVFSSIDLYIILLI